MITDRGLHSIWGKTDIDHFDSRTSSLLRSKPNDSHICCHDNSFKLNIFPVRSRPGNYSVLLLRRLRDKR